MLVYTRFENKPLLFSSPKAVISCNTPSDLKRAFEALESLLDKGYYIAGFLSYEAGYGFEDKLKLDKTYKFPLLYMGCYSRPVPAKDFLKKASGTFRVSGLKTSLSYEDYQQNIRRIHDFISIGDVYQITYCIKMKFQFEGSETSLFSRLLHDQPVPYPAYIEADRFKVVSLSPEMFMKRNGRLTSTKPMKGTWPRRKNPVLDFAARFQLKYDLKNRAENVMITDLLRNDLGRIGEDVNVTRLFEVSSYKTLYQMTSSIEAKVKNNISVYDIFASLFPSGSVTGAPKIRAMEVIREIETEERNIYTGAIGFIAPDRSFYFNIPIRTLLLEGGKGEMGIGGGIIWDSTPQGEWDEGILKAKFLTDISVR
ncbi:MAG: chorismate-binding protein [Elusimicrobia bacterium]|nr:chorismate-binding protein [Candidatus Liberimonas magnetica]